LKALGRILIEIKIRGRRGKTVGEFKGMKI
jgi:hypothetical protein